MLSVCSSYTRVAYLLQAHPPVPRKFIRLLTTWTTTCWLRQSTRARRWHSNPWTGRTRVECLATWAWVAVGRHSHRCILWQKHLQDRIQWANSMSSQTQSVFHSNFIWLLVFDCCTFCREREREGRRVGGRCFLNVRMCTFHTGFI